MEDIGKAIDPVCKMEVDKRTAKWKSEYKGRTYYFCAPGCKQAFEEEPERYLKIREYRKFYSFLFLYFLLYCS
nr:YHS domain-containing protein [Candidatus Freyrarchaeum guaymaensis]